MKFTDLGLSKPILLAIQKSGYDTPTPVQQQAIPAILTRKDVLAGAQTGTGKTAAFTLPILERLLQNNINPQQRQIKALILVPTRELANQVEENVKAYAAHTQIKSAVIFGGVKIQAQIYKLKRGFDILVATPGRLLDHVQRRTVNLSQVETLVLDEADRMLDMGFIHDIRRILEILPKQRQNLMFSATYSPSIRDLANNLLKDPIRIDVTPRNTTPERVKQIVHPVDRQRKPELLSYLIGSRNWQQVLVFVRTKHGADRLMKQLINSGLPAMAIHGNKSQGARSRALSEFKNGTIRVLVATDIAARGLDIEKLPHVVNFDLPMVAEDYVHRIGRTARAGQAGAALSLVSADENKALASIERLLNHKIEREIIVGFEPAQNNKQQERSHQNHNHRKHQHRSHSEHAPHRHRGQRNDRWQHRAKKQRDG